MYGKPEKCSVDLFLTILLNVGSGDTNRPIAKIFPAAPAASLQILETKYKCTGVIAPSTPMNLARFPRLGSFKPEPFCKKMKSPFMLKNMPLVG